MNSLRRMLILWLVLMLLLVSCSGPSESEQKGPIIIATMIDAEGAVLGQMMVLMLEANGFAVTDRTEFGTPDILRRALENGEVDLVLDYTGSGQYYHVVEDTDIWSDAAAGYERTRQLDADTYNIQWLTPAMANNTEMLALKRDFADEHAIRDMYDFAAYVNRGGRVKLITSASFAENIKGLLGYEQAYGFQLSQDQLIVLSAGNTAEMLLALTEGRNDVNVSLVYGTDGALDQLNLVIIEDPLSIPPVYLPTPVLRGELHEAYPEIEDILAPVFESLNLERLQQLNARVAFEGQEAARVARDYLTDQGFLED